MNRVKDKQQEQYVTTNIQALVTQKTDWRWADLRGRGRQSFI